MKKILIIILFTIMMLNSISAKEKISNNKLFWTLYATNIGIQVGISTSIFVQNIIVNSLNNNYNMETFSWDIMLFVLQLTLVDSLNAIPLAGPFISASLYCFFGTLALTLYSVKKAGLQVSLMPNEDTFLSNGIFSLINSMIILPFGIIMYYLNKKSQIFKKKDISVDLGINMNTIMCGINIKL